MSHDVFISYAVEDKPVADAACSVLEGRGIRCWISPRDLLPGIDRGEAIIDAINNSRVVVLVFSNYANFSYEVKREIERAVNKGLTIIPFRIEDVPLSRSLEYFLSVPHWLDALTPPIYQHLVRLADTIANILVGIQNEPPYPHPIIPGTNQVRSAVKWIVPVSAFLAIFTIVTFYFIYRAVFPKTDLETFRFEVATLDDAGKRKGGVQRDAKLYKEDLGNGQFLEMVEVPAGKFWMGISSTEFMNVFRELQRAGLPTQQAQQIAQSETPHGQVKVVSFFLSRTEVSQAQWASVVDWPKVKQTLNSHPSFFQGDGHPVEQVTWDEANEFCARLSARTGRPYRLPSESEWEFACHAGTVTPYYFGNAITDDVANFNSSLPWGKVVTAISRREAYPTGKIDAPNAFGLLDMHGNVQEWCMDPWHPNYQGSPSGASVWEKDADLRYRVVRGGSYSSAAAFSRCTSREHHEPDRRSRDTGFRVAIFLDDVTNADR